MTRPTQQLDPPMIQWEVGNVCSDDEEKESALGVGVCVCQKATCDGAVTVLMWSCFSRAYRCRCVRPRSQSGALTVDPMAEYSYILLPEAVPSGTVPPLARHLTFLVAAFADPDSLNGVDVVYHRSLFGA